MSGSLCRSKVSHLVENSLCHYTETIECTTNGVTPRHLGLPCFIMKIN